MGYSMRYNNRGYMIDFKMPKAYKDENTYYVVCQYLYDHDKNNYTVTFYLERKDIAKLHEMYTVTLCGENKTIKKNIAKYVQEEYDAGRYDAHIENLIYEDKCFTIGNEIEEGKRGLNYDCIGEVASTYLSQ